MSDELVLSAILETADFDAGMEIVTGALREVGSIAVDALGAAAGAALDFFGDSFSGALEAEQTMARLGQVIESTGGAAGVTLDEAGALADEFKHLAGGSDDAVLSIIDMGLRMGTISSEEMPSFIQSTLDLSAVMGDAGKAAQLMARAQEDPVGVLGALRKAGILVNEETEAQIKTMVAAGDTAGAYSLLMDRVNEATAGAAETMASTTAGEWAIFQETIADAGETIMGAFLPAINSIAGPIADTVIPIIEQFATQLAADLPLAIAQTQAFLQPLFDFFVVNFPLMQATAETVFTAIQGVMTVLGDFITVTLMPAIASIWEQTGLQLPTTQATFEAVMGAIVIATQMVSDFVTLVLVPALTAAVDWVVVNWPMIQATIETVWAVVQVVFQAISDFLATVVIPAFASAVDWVVVNWPMIQATIEAVMAAVNAVITTVLNAVIPFAIAMFDQVKAWTDTNWPLIQQTIETVLGAINAVITTVMTAISAFWQANHETIETVASTIWENIKLVIENTILIIEGILRATMQVINGDWSGAWTTVQDTLTAIWANLQAATQNTMTAIQAIISSIVSAVSAFWQATWNALMAAVIAILNGIYANVTNSLNLIYTMIAAKVQATFTYWTGTWDTLKAVVSSILAGILGTVTSVLSSIYNTIATQVQNVYNFWTSSWNSMARAIASTVTGILSTVSQTVYDIVQAFATVDWAGIGFWLIENIQNGIGAAVGGLVNAAAQAALDAYNAAKAALGISSPSKLLMSIGEHFGVDMSSGMRRTLGEVVSTATEMGRSMVAPLTAPSMARQVASHAYTDARTFQLNARTEKPLASLASEFSTMQVLAGVGL